MSKSHAVASSPQSFSSVAVRQNAHSAAAPTFPCRQRGWREIASLLNFLALLPRRRGLYLFERLESPWRSFRREGTLPVEARAMALNQVTLDDKYDLAKSRIFVTGFQALVRLSASTPRAMSPAIAARRSAPSTSSSTARSARSTNTTSAFKPESTRTSRRPRSGARSRPSCAARASSTACSAFGTARVRASTAPATSSVTPISPARPSMAACWRSWATTTPQNLPPRRISPNITSSTS